MHGCNFGVRREVYFSVGGTPPAQVDDAPGHHHIHGANLGVRGSAYGWVGGFRALAESEDVDLVERLVASGARVERVADCRVVTSARVSRRTGGGMSGYLDELAARGVAAGDSATSGDSARCGASVPAGETALEPHRPA